MRPAIIVIVAVFIAFAALMASPSEQASACHRGGVQPDCDHGVNPPNPPGQLNHDDGCHGANHVQCRVIVPGGRSGSVRQDCIRSDDHICDTGGDNGPPGPPTTPPGPPGAPPGPPTTPPGPPITPPGHPGAPPGPPSAPPGPPFTPPGPPGPADEPGPGVVAEVQPVTQVPTPVAQVLPQRLPVAGMAVIPASVWLHVLALATAALGGGMAVLARPWRR